MIFMLKKCLHDRSESRMNMFTDKTNHGWRNELSFLVGLGQLTAVVSLALRGLRMTSLSVRLVLIPVLAVAVPEALQARALKGSKHDLSVTGGGGVKSVGENQMCVFCHASHHAGKAPLWNHNASAVTYIPYASSTMKAHPGQPTGASKLCLSCHDGTVALGSLKSRKSPVNLKGGAGKMPKGHANLGTDLSDDHPISFPYDSALASLSGESSRIRLCSIRRSGWIQTMSCSVRPVTIPIATSMIPSS